MITQDDIKKQKHEYYLKNRQRYLERAKQWRESNPEKAKLNLAKSCKKWRGNNKDKIKILNQKYSRIHSDRGRSVARAKYLDLRGNMCVHCGYTKNLHFHHTNYDFDEGVTLCATCHKNVHLGKIKRFKVEVG